MIRFEDLSPEVWASICSPINEVFPARPPPLTSSSSYPSSRPTSVRRKSSLRVVDSSRNKYRPKTATKATINSRGTGALYIGSWCAGVDQELLDSHKITQIVSIQDSTLSDYIPDHGLDVKCQNTSGSSGVVSNSGPRGVYRIHLLDSPSAELRPHLEGACEFIREKIGRGENVLVHCQQVSRVLLWHLTFSRSKGYLQFVPSFSFL